MANSPPIKLDEWNLGPQSGPIQQMNKNIVKRVARSSTDVPYAGYILKKNSTKKNQRQIVPPMVRYILKKKKKEENWNYI